MDGNKVISYAFRRVNPFLGVMQVIEAEGGRAHSTKFQLSMSAPTPRSRHIRTGRRK